MVRELIFFNVVCGVQFWRPCTAVAGMITAHGYEACAASGPRPRKFPWLEIPCGLIWYGM